MKTLELKAHGVAIALESGAKRTRRRFSMEAYTGDVFEHPIFGPSVIDLAGLDVPTSGVPAYRQHDPNRFVGRVEEVKNSGERVSAAGFLFGDVPAAEEVARISDQGGKWQASISVNFSDDFETVREGSSVRVNGRTLSGPLTVIRRATLKEISFVPIGADRATSAVALSAEDHDRKLAALAGVAREAKAEDVQAAVELGAQAFEDLLREKTKQTGDPSAALAEARQKHPRLHAAFVARANPPSQTREIFARFGPR